MAIMISIQPQHCENILNQIKTLEIRKSCPKEWKDYLSGKTKVKPKAEKVYIYCSWGDMRTNYMLGKRGKVVACFVLNEVEELTQDYSEWLPKQVYDVTEKQLKDMCLTQSELWNYGKGKPFYAWHIDDLQIYDVPRELGEFKYPDKTIYYEDNKKAVYGYLTGGKLTRPPQSWCRCEELEE